MHIVIGCGRARRRWGKRTVGDLEEAVGYSGRADGGEEFVPRLGNGDKWDGGRQYYSTVISVEWEVVPSVRMLSAAPQIGKKGRIKTSMKCR